MFTTAHARACMDTPGYVLSNPGIHLDSINYTKYTLGSCEKSFYIPYAILSLLIHVADEHILLECLGFKVQNPFRNLAPDWVYSCRVLG